MERKKDTWSPTDRSVRLSQFALAKEFTAATYASTSTIRLPYDEEQGDHSIKSSTAAIEVP